MSKQQYIPKITTPAFLRKMRLPEVRKYIFNELRKYAEAGEIVINEDLNIPIHFDSTTARENAYGEAIYYKKAAVVSHIRVILKHATYNNWGERKPTDRKDLIGYLNFKCKCILDNEPEYLRIAVRFYQNGKFYYNIEVNKKPAKK